MVILAGAPKCDMDRPMPQDSFGGASSEKRVAEGRAPATGRSRTGDSLGDNAEPSYGTMGEPAGLHPDVEHIEEVEWADPEDVKAGRYTDKAPRPAMERTADPCGCVPDESSAMCCVDASCFLFACQEECRSNCDAGPLCGNKRIQKKQWKKLEVIDAGPKGRGLRVMENVKKGDFITEYVGVAIKKEHLDSLFRRYQSERMLYIMALDNDVYIDARKKGGIARYINHSCEPSCMVDRWKVRGISRACVFAMRDIAAGEELSFDYKWTRKRGRAPTKCHCGTISCRGTLEMTKESSLEDEELQMKLSGHWKVPVNAKPGKEIINRVIKVHFNSDHEYYAADVAQFDEKTRMHQIIYKSDLSDAWEDLSKLQWMILDREMEQFVIARKETIRPAPLGTSITPPSEAHKAALGKNYILIQTTIKELLEERRIIAKCENHCQAKINISLSEGSEKDSPDGIKALEGSKDGMLWKLVVVGINPSKAITYIVRNVENLKRKADEAAAFAAKEAAKSALDTDAASALSREVVVPRSIVDSVKRNLYMLRGKCRNMELNFSHSDSKSKQFAKLIFEAESALDLERALGAVWTELFKLCAEAEAPLTPSGVFKDLGIMGGRFMSEEFNLLFQDSGHSLRQDCSENLRENPFFASFEDMHRCTIWVQAEGDMGRIDSQNRIVGEADQNIARKVFIGAEPNRVKDIWNLLRSRVTDLIKGVKFVNVGADRVYFPSLLKKINRKDRMGGDFFMYVQHTTGASVRVDNLTRNHLRIDGGDVTKEKDESRVCEINRRITFAEELVRLQIELLRDHFVRKQRWVFGRDWSLLMDVDPSVRKKSSPQSAQSRSMSPTPSSFSTVRHTTDARAVATSCMEIAEISSALELDRSVAAHACIIFYRFLNQISEIAPAASSVKLRDAALSSLFIANKTQKVQKWKRLEVVVEAAYKIFYAGARFDVKSEEAKNWEKRVIAAENEILSMLQYDVFWPGVDWIVSSAVESGKLPEALVENALDLALSGPVFAAGSTVWLKLGPEYAFAAMAGLLSMNIDAIFAALPLIPIKVSQAAEIIYKSIKQNAAASKKYSAKKSASSNTQAFGGGQMSLFNNVPHLQQACNARMAKGVNSATKSKDLKTVSTWEKANMVIARRSRQMRWFKGVSLGIIKERIIPVLDGICAESRCDIFFQESTQEGMENIVLEGSWRAISIAEYLLKSAVSQLPASALYQPSQALGVAPGPQLSTNSKTLSTKEHLPSSGTSALSHKTGTVGSAPSSSSDNTLPASEERYILEEGIEKKEVRFLPGVMKMSDIEFTNGWDQANVQATPIVEDPREKKPKIGGKSCLPAIALEASFTKAGLRWWIPPVYGPSQTGSLCDILSIRRRDVSDKESHFKELAKLAACLDSNGGDSEEPCFNMMKTQLSGAQLDTTDEARSVAVSLQRWPPGKIEQKEKARGGSMQVGFSPTALQEMQLLQQLHFLIPAPQGHPNFILPVAIALDSTHDQDGVNTTEDIMGKPVTTASCSSDVMSLLAMVRRNPLEEKKKRPSTGSHIVFQPTPLVLQKVISRCSKKRSSSVGAVDKRGGSRLITPTIFAAWFHDLLSALAMCHSNHIVVRKIDPDQVLIDYSGVAMLSSLARSIVLPASDRRRFVNPLKSARGKKSEEDPSGDPYVAPEALLGSLKFTKETDVFSLGALMAQLLINKPLFSGRDRCSKLRAMYKVIGTPGSDNYPDGKRYPYYSKSKFEDTKKYKKGVDKALRYMLKDTDLDVDEFAGALQLIEMMLDLDPEKRISAADALNHDFITKYVNKVKSDGFREVFVTDWMLLRDTVLLDRDLKSNNENKIGLLQKNVSVAALPNKREKDKKRKAMLLEAAGKEFGEDDDDLYNMDDILGDHSNKKAKVDSS